MHDITQHCVTGYIVCMIIQRKKYGCDTFKIGSVLSQRGYLIQEKLKRPCTLNNWRCNNR